MYSSELIKELPALAWLFSLSSSGEKKLIHGRAVEKTDAGFLEGVYAGECQPDFSQATNVFGSGIIMTEQHCTLVSPSHTLEAVFLYQHRGGWGVSNSLALLLEHYGLTIPWNLHYGGIFASAALGTKDYEKCLFRTTEGKVLRIMYSNVQLATDGKYQLVDKPMPPAFKNYHDYIEYLEKTLREVFAMAARPERQSVYQPLATCSSGYDSSAGAVLVRRLGYGEAITLRTARGGTSDTGRWVGEAMGLNVREVDRTESVAEGFALVAPFIATGMGGQDYCFHGFAPLLENKILLTGFHGDKIWEAKVEPGDVLARGDVSGSSLQEFRLWKNFLHVPVPMIGARRHADIAAISRSPEMAPYRLDNDYDRPIPRRLLEERGVPRASFGHSKQAASLLLFSQPQLFDAASRQEYESLVPAAWIKSAKSPVHNWVRRGQIRAHRLVQRIARRFPPVSALGPKIMPAWPVFEHSHPLASLEFCAAITKIRADYRQALGRF